MSEVCEKQHLAGRYAKQAVREQNMSEADVSSAGYWQPCVWGHELSIASSPQQIDLNTDFFQIACYIFKIQVWM